MHHEILVPLDGSTFSEMVLPHAVALARSTGSTVTLLRVIGYPLTVEPLAWPGNIPPVRPIAHEGECTVARTYLAEIATRLEQRGIPTRAEVLEGDPAAAIVARAGTSQQTTLIAMATHGYSGVRHWMLGSVAEKVLHAAPVPLLLVRPHKVAQGQAETATYRTIVVPLDGSAFAEQALAEAEAIACPQDAALLLVSILEDPPAEMVGLSDVGAAEAGIVPHWRLADRQVEIERLRRYLQTQAGRLQARGIAVRTELAYGRPAEEIRAVAAEQRADLIVMATHGRGGFQCFWLGSVARKLMHVAETPILLIRAGKQREQHEYGTSGIAKDASVGRERLQTAATS